MKNTYQIIEIQEKNGELSFLQQEVDLQALPEQMNGESGAHICYVQVLTELLARQLTLHSDRYQLTEEQIRQITLAASLHDVGKTQVPSAILHKDGSLTPIEFDIVKKHTLLGEQLIAKKGKQLDPEVLDYARQIARSHHERYDGMGYPDGLSGDAIPIAAQLVSIADAYEALTEERHYKQVYSRDVALDMISNGMCGVFNPILLECLIEVVDKKQLEDISTSILTSRSVYSDPYAKPPQKVLLLGNTKYVTQPFLHATFPESHITIVGEDRVGKSGGAQVFAAKEVEYQQLLDANDYDVILYFSRELTFHAQEPGDTEELRRFLEATQYAERSTKILYLSSLDAALTQQTDHGILAAAKESLCTYWSKQNSMDIKVVRIPYLYSGTEQSDYLFRLFEQARLSGRIELGEPEEAKTYFLSQQDLSELLRRIVDSWTTGAGVLVVNDPFEVTFGQLGSAISGLFSQTETVYTDIHPPKPLNASNAVVKRQYGWFAKLSILTELREQYESYSVAAEPKERRWKKLLRQDWGHSRLVRIAELLILFVLSELLIHLTGYAAAFSIIDFRLTYIVIAATLYGLSYGLGAAALASLSLCIARVVEGANWLWLFYEPTNWLPLIFYFLVGAVCGYTVHKNRDTIRFWEEENRLLEGRLVFTRKLYEDTFAERQALKKQIISTRDSFGKIFDITRRFNTVDSRELFLHMIESFEDILQNRTICVYSLSEGSGFGRMEAASRNVVQNTAYSISLDTYAPVMESIRRGEVWRNSELLPNMPMFACGIYQDEKPLLLIFLWQAEMHQCTLYYVNLLHILCKLAQISFIRAYNYNEAVREKQYLAGTRIQNADVFESTLQSFRDSSEQKISTFLLLEVDSGDRSPEEMNDLLNQCTRANDIFGMTENGGIRVLLPQARPENLELILSRFTACGVQARLVE